MSVLINGCQNNFPYPEIKNFGCYYLTLCKWAELNKEFVFNESEIINNFERYKKLAWIGVNSWIKEPVKIINDLMKENKFTTAEFSKFIPDTNYFPVFYDSKITHFVLGKKNNNEAEIVFDGWNPSAKDRGLTPAILNPYRKFK